MGKKDLREQLDSDITTPSENHGLYTESRDKARIDEMTGPPNRDYLDEMLGSEIGRHSRYGGVFSLIILDLDSFKAFNDNYGHGAGDDLLKRIGSLIESSTRSADRTFRCGSDEFAVLLPNTHVDAANQVAERIRKQITSEMMPDGIQTTASFGLASWPIDGLVTSEIITATDAALNHAKQSGGNRTHWVSEVLQPLDNATVSSKDSEGDEASKAIYALAAIVDARKDYYSNHWRKVKVYATAIAKALNLERQSIDRLETCALLHDIGKIAISDKIINKQGKLTTDEWAIIKTHPQIGASIAGRARQFSPCIAGILYHHERYDGNGYPKGLRGENIPLDARVLSVADAFSAMTSDRSYSSALPIQMALEEIKQGSSSQFDPNLVEVFFSIVENT